MRVAIDVSARFCRNGWIGEPTGARGSLGVGRHGSGFVAGRSQACTGLDQPGAVETGEAGTELLRSGHDQGFELGQYLGSGPDRSDACDA